jgi:hypothetical protein
LLKIRGVKASYARTVGGGVLLPPAGCSGGGIILDDGKGNNQTGQELSTNQPSKLSQRSRNSFESRNQQIPHHFGVEI